MQNYNYTSIGAFLAETEKAPHKSNYQEASDNYKQDKNDSKDWSEAKNWILNGREDLEKFNLKTLESDFNDIKNQFTLELQNSVSGCFVNIGAFVTGSPENMYYYETTETPRVSKIIDLSINTTISWSITNDQIMEAGKEILKAVYALELEGYSISVNCFTHIRDKGKRKDQDFKFSIDVKNHGERLNPNSFFSVVSTDFVRRLYFRFTERLLKGESKKFATSGRGACLMNDGDIILNKAITDGLTYTDIVKQVKALNKKTFN